MKLQFTIKQARKYAGFTQEAMAKILNISRDTYRTYEIKPQIIPMGKAIEFSQAVGIELKDIIFYHCSLLKVDSTGHQTTLGHGKGGLENWFANSSAHSPKLSCVMRSPLTVTYGSFVKDSPGIFWAMLRPY